MFGKGKSSSSLAGPGYMVLNGIRFLNIVALLAVAIASWVMIVMNIKTNHFFFFDIIAHLITSIISILLIISECNLFATYFARNWPKFSDESGFVFLGLSMIVLGFNVLSNLNKEANSVQTLGLPMWRTVISSGILVSVMGPVNIIASYIFCNKMNGITGRQVRSHGAVLPSFSNGKESSSSRSNSTRSNMATATALPLYNEPVVEENRRSRFGFKLPIRISHISRPVPTNQAQFSKWHNRSQPVLYDDKVDEVNAPLDRSSPVYPELQRPPTAAHPIFRMPYPNPPPPPASSRYSVASDITRF